MPTARQSSPTPSSSNRILAKLSAADRRRMAEYLNPINLPLGEIINEADEKHSYAFFPVSCMISFVAVTDGGSTLEVGIVGREGMVGVVLALGVEHSPVRAIVQGKGSAIRIPAGEFCKAVEKNAALRAEVLRYAYESMKMAMLFAACNNIHSLEARLARWLLMTRDYLSTTTFETTQDFLGKMLGVARPSVNVVAAELQRRGLISYRRGVVKLLDPAALREAACSCYAKMGMLSGIRESGTVAVSSMLRVANDAGKARATSPARVAD